MSHVLKELKLKLVGVVVVVTVIAVMQILGWVVACHDRTLRSLVKRFLMFCFVAVKVVRNVVAVKNLRCTALR